MTEFYFIDNQETDIDDLISITDDQNRTYSYRNIVNLLTQQDELFDIQENRIQELRDKNKELVRKIRKRVKKIKVLQYNINRQQEALYEHNLEIKKLKNDLMRYKGLLGEIEDVVEDTGAISRTEFKELMIK